MCGILSVIGNITHVQEKIFKELLQVDVIRGAHSTGIMNVLQSGEVNIFKRACLPQDLIDSKGYNTAMAGKSQVLVGHNRWATKGKINATNAHPFEVGSITGVHNGTLKGQYLLPDHLEYDVDSENIMHALNIEEVEDVIPMLHGAYALLWHDSSNGTFNLIHNKERPLYVTQEKISGCLWFTSEAWMVEGVLWRNGVEFETSMSVATDVLHSFTLTTGLAMIRPPKPLVKALDGYSPPLPAIIKKPKTSSDSNTASTVIRSTKLEGGYELTVGDQARFFVDTISDSDRSSPTVRVEGSLTRALLQDVTCYIPKGTTLLEEMRNEDSEFSGEVVAMFRDRGQAGRGPALNIILNPTSIHRTAEGMSKPADTGEVVIVDSEGNSISEKKYEDITARGCAWCTDVPTKYESETLQWVGDNDFVCFACQATPEVKDYLNPTLGVEH
jgi:hypothetical protein